MGDAKQDRGHEKLYLRDDETDNDWRPSSTTAIKLLFVSRIIAVVYGIICDREESYNYWETLHVFLYGEGFQTMEYSPAHATRSYFFIIIHFIPASFSAFFIGYSKIAVFTMVRLSIASACLGGEYYAFISICERISNRAGVYFLFINVFSGGMFQASISFSPWTFSMICTLYFLGSFLQEKWKISMFCILLSSLVGWPLTGFLLFPLFIQMLIKSKLKSFFTYFFATGFLILIVQHLVDQYFYGKPVVIPYNFFIKSFSDRNDTENLAKKLMRPITNIFQKNGLVQNNFRNIFIDWNVLGMLSAFSFPVILNRFLRQNASDAPKFLGLPIKISLLEKLSPIALLFLFCLQWTWMMALQLQNEPKNMYPIYPLFSFFSALTLDGIWNWQKPKMQGIQSPGGITTCTIALFYFLFSIARIISIQNNFAAHADIYKTFQKELLVHEQFSQFHNPIRLCLSKEWYHYPSSFFLPKEVYDGESYPRRVEMRFLDYGADVIYPIQFIDSFEKMTKNATDEMKSFVSLDSCDYVIEFESEYTQDLDLKEHRLQWLPVESMPMLGGDYPTRIPSEIATFNKGILTLYRKIKHY